MKITDITLTLFAWDSIPSTTYGHHTARPTGKSDLGLLRIATDEGIEGHAFLGTSSNPASLDGPGLIRFLKPVVMGQDPLDRERLNKLLWARARVATVRAIGGAGPAALIAQGDALLIGGASIERLDGGTLLSDEEGGSIYDGGGGEEGPWDCLNAMMRFTGTALTFAGLVSTGCVGGLPCILALYFFIDAAYKVVVACTPWVL